MCLACNGWSPHIEWYHEEAPVEEQIAEVHAAAGGVPAGMVVPLRAPEKSALEMEMGALFSHSAMLLGSGGNSLKADAGTAFDCC